MLKTDICHLFGIKYPIIQGAMAHLATAELVSAVSDVGGLGIIAAANYEGEWLRQQIRLTRKMTSKPFGVNIFLLSPVIEDQIRVIIEENVPVVVTGAGNPERYLPRLKSSGSRIVTVVGDVSSARKAVDSGSDVIVAEGMEAGGHIGQISLLSLLPQVIDVVTVPVVAAGGIADGRGLAGSLSLGAQGIQMGTRFICSRECLAHPDFKSRIVKAGARDTVVIGQFSGHPMRCLKNQFTSEYLTLEKSGATPEELGYFMAGRVHLGIIEGKIDEGALPAGQSCGLIKDIKPVKAIIDDIMIQAENILLDLPRKLFREENHD